MRHPWATGDFPTALGVLSLVFSPEFVNAPDAQARMAALAPAFPQTQEGRLSAISAPTLVIAGEQDIITPPRHGQAVADAIAGARIETLFGPGSSHALGLERATEFVTLVLKFLAIH